jgi:hypothetical protein
MKSVITRNSTYNQQASKERFRLSCPKARRSRFLEAPSVLLGTVAASSASLRRGIVATLLAHLLELAATSAFPQYFYSHPPKYGQSETLTESL